jgi:hypothetical protein
MPRAAARGVCAQRQAARAAPRCAAPPLRALRSAAAVSVRGPCARGGRVRKKGPTAEWPLRGGQAERKGGGAPPRPARRPPAATRAEFGLSACGATAPAPEPPSLSGPSAAQRRAAAPPPRRRAVRATVERLRSRAARAAGRPPTGRACSPTSRARPHPPALSNGALIRAHTHIRRIRVPCTPLSPPARALDPRQPARRRADPAAGPVTQ